MRKSTKENLVITALGLGSAIAVVAGGTLFAIYVADWQKWTSAVFWTAFIFGFAIYWFGRDLLKPRCLAIFAVLLLVHVTVLSRYLVTADRFPDVFFLVFSPVEATLVGVALMLVGGKPSREGGRPRRHRLRLKHDTSESINSSGSSDAEGGRGKPL